MLKVLSTNVPDRSWLNGIKTISGYWKHTWVIMGPIGNTHVHIIANAQCSQTCIVVFLRPSFVDPE